MRYVMIFLSLVTTTCYAFDTCKPSFDLSHRNYLIGYGSLMETNSRLRTNPEARHAYPLELYGYERVWGMHAGHYKCTFLTLIKKPTSYLNAVYYPVTVNDIKATDQRESYYCRVRVSRKEVRFLSAHQPPRNATLWVYVEKPGALRLPNASYPIVQSYVDIFLNGCLQIQQHYHLNGFAQQCITTSRGWAAKNAWVNDRVHARRPFASVPKARIIDRLLAQHVPDYYDHPIE